MKKLLIFISFILLSYPASARYQSGYYKPSTGTYVYGHYKTDSDSTKWNNYSTKGNINPYTGAKGYKSPYKTYTTKTYKSKK